MLRHANLQTNRLEIFIFLCSDDSNSCALLNHNFVVSLTLVRRLHARLSCASPPASLTDESLMHMASEAIQCEFGIIVGKLLLALEVAKCRHRSAHGERSREIVNISLKCAKDIRLFTVRKIFTSITNTYYGTLKYIQKKLWIIYE